MGGGNCFQLSIASPSIGLSPRGRGKHPLTQCAAPHSWSIPAWAGETKGCQRARKIAAVYPRVGGGNARTPFQCRTLEGLSPRGRGKPCCSARKTPSARSIPAWAGETARKPSTNHSITVYPRVGGGNLTAGIVYLADKGLSPRGRGKLHTRPPSIMR